MRIVGRPDESAKVYTDPRPVNLEDRLDTMVKNHPHVLPGQLAWPKDLVEDSRGAVVGYLQDYFGGDYVELTEMVSPATRPRWATQRELRRFAYESAYIMAELHSESFLFPDFHPGQLLVSPTGPTVLIDVGSCQFTMNGVFYPCDVAKPDYQPPDFYGTKSWPTVAADRDVYTDAWSLAVTLFRITQSCEPFAGKHVGAGNGLKPAERAVHGQFPFSKNCREYTPPQNAAPYRLVHPELRDLFERCFVDGHQSDNRSLRPTAQEFADTLQHLTTLRTTPLPHIAMMASSTPTGAPTKTPLGPATRVGAAKHRVRCLLAHFATWATFVPKPVLLSAGATVVLAATFLAGVLATNNSASDTSLVEEWNQLFAESPAATKQADWNVFEKPNRVDPERVIDKLRAR